MKPSELLIKAKALIADPKHWALGWTLPHGTLGYPEDYKAFDLARSIVMERLEGQPSLEGWIKKQGFFFPTKLSPEVEQKLRNHRLQWLNLLIA